MIAFLLSSGAVSLAERSIFDQNRDSASPLALAVENDCYSVVKLLLSIKKARAEIRAIILQAAQVGNFRICGLVVCFYPSAYIQSKWKVLKCNPCIRNPKEMSMFIKSVKNSNLKLMKLFYELDVPYVSDFDQEGNNILQIAISQHRVLFQKSVSSIHSSSSSSSSCSNSAEEEREIQSSVRMDDHFRSIFKCISSWELNRWLVVKKELSGPDIFSSISSSINININVCGCSSRQNETLLRNFFDHNLFETRNYFGQVVADRIISGPRNTQGRTIGCETAIDRFDNRQSEMLLGIYNDLFVGVFGSRSQLKGQRNAAKNLAEISSSSATTATTTATTTTAAAAKVSKSNLNTVPVSVDNSFDIKYSRLDTKDVSWNGEEISGEGCEHIIDQESDAVEFNMALSSARNHRSY
jgi:hypothetical protein